MERDARVEKRIGRYRDGARLVLTLAGSSEFFPLLGPLRRNLTTLLHTKQATARTGGKKSLHTYPLPASGWSSSTESILHVQICVG
ncbi:hypothetical protein RRG08_049613 [Elysia crispata]|uniref:Uncharacterized protein n=1 Tax=Elysia crispata TaxID=231223 RepID=A0AAE1AUK8_9GAST|nr:hypothetical protein RRG08_049613 [Elysia crispata]